MYRVHEILALLSRARHACRVPFCPAPGLCKKLDLYVDCYKYTLWSPKQVACPSLNQLAVHFRLSANAATEAIVAMG